MVLIALFATALFRMAKSGHTLARSKSKSPEKKDHLVQPSMGQQCQDQPGEEISARRR